MSELPDSTIRRLSDFATEKWRLLVRKDIDSSLIYAQKAAGLARYLSSDSLLFHAYRRSASSLTEKGMLELARIYCDSMLPLFDSIDHYESFRYFSTLGIVEFYDGRFQEALDLHFKSLESARAGGLNNHIGAAYNEISRVFDRMGQLDKALEYAEKDREHTMLHGGNRDKFIANYNFATRYMNLDSFDKAMQLFDVADSMSKVAGIPYYEVAVSLNRGDLYNRMGEPGKALPLLEDAMVKMNDFGDQRGHLTAKLHYGKALSNLERYRESVVVLKSVYDSLKVTGFQELLQGCRKAYAQALYESGDGSRAYELMDEFRIIQDSLKGEETTKTINELEVQYQTAQKENQLLEQQIEIVQRTRERNRTFWLAGFLAVLAVSIYLFQRQLILKNRRLASQAHEIQRQKIAQLENEKKILAMASMIEGQEAERIRIAKDLHDGLGVLLSSVRRQVQNIQIEMERLNQIDLVGDTERLISTACEEVRRISHDMMPDALLNLGLGEAISDLAYQIQSDHGIKTTVDVPDDLRLEEIQAINIYRIVQEVSNNMIKYAAAKNFVVEIQEIADYLEIQIRDDGTGFDPEEARKKGGIGLQSIESRVNFLNGTIAFNLESGTMITILIPLKSK